MKPFYLGVLGLLLAVVARAEPMIPLPIETLAAKAQLILRGTVASQTVQRDPEGRIYTKIELKVAEVWKGSLATNRFTIVHGGGVLGDERVEVSRQVTYEPGEEVVAFLVLNQRGEGVTIGLCQGKFRVETDTGTGEKLAHGRFHGGGNGADAGRRLTVSALRQRVAEATR